MYPIQIEKSLFLTMQTVKDMHLTYAYNNIIIF